ncbi:hypothetical protein D770_22880 [Flammeovirgaceae bacterium 311]|nr:hypothetical protein D770_22880 [Flammeovirgaceae bacterium 311]
MKFLADENIPLRLITQLQEKGWDIKYVGAKNAGIEDEEVLDLANQENRVLLTFDSDFGELIFRKGKVVKTGIIYFRLDQFLPDEPGTLLLTLLEEDSIDFLGKISVVTKENVRQRKITE